MSILFIYSCYISKVVLIIKLIILYTLAQYSSQFGTLIYISTSLNVLWCLMHCSRSILKL